MAGVSPSPEARQLAIAEAVIRRGTMRVEQLADLTGVSVMTVYRDLAVLESSGVVQRHRGDVIALASGMHEADAGFRLSQNERAKREIAACAAQFIPAAASLMVDDSTSSIWLLRALPQLSGMTIVTSSQLVAEEAAQAHVSRLVVIGGEYQPWAHATAGSAAVHQIRRLHASVCALSTSGISQGGCFHPHEEIAEVKAAMLESADVRLLLTDSSKLHRQALFRFASLADFDHVVVDSAATAEDVAALEDFGAVVHVAESLPA